MRFSLNPDLSMRKVGNELFVYNRARSFIHSFNETGAFLWEQICRCDTDEMLVEALVREFEVREPAARNDVESFLDALHRQELIRFHDQGE